MRRPAYHRDQRGRLDVKMTPMIDVIFLLLIFFVCTANFRPEEILPTRISTPGASQSDVQVDPLEEDLDEIVVKVLWRMTGAGWRARWEINQRQYDQLAQVRDVLSKARQVQANLPVILDVEPAVPMEHVIDVYDLCRRVGLENVQFAAEEGA